MDEWEKKLGQIRALIEKFDLGGFWLRRVSSFAWATCGAASYVNTATSEAETTLLVTPSHHYILTNNIEADRLRTEESLEEQGWEFNVTDWYKPMIIPRDLIGGARLGADSLIDGGLNLGDEMARLRSGLSVPEQDRLRALGRSCAEIMETAIQSVQPGMTEYEISGILALEAQQRGVQAIVNLIAVDERIFAYRHPLPTSKRLERYAMLVLSGRRFGLVCSITRLIHFGEMAADLKRKIYAVAEIDAGLIARTRPGCRLGEIFQQTVLSYERVGFGEEWKRHHQGGVVGYEPREALALPDSHFEVLVGQAYAWNPSISGAKSEDTILVGESENEVVTSIPNWPLFTIRVGAIEIGRPAVLVID